MLLLWWLAVLGPRHGLAGLVNITRPSLVGVCGVCLGEGNVGVVVAGAPEEGLGFCANGHCLMCMYVGEFEGDVRSAALTTVCTDRSRFRSIR